MIVFKKMVAYNFVRFPELMFDFEKTGLLVIEGENKDSDSASSNGAGKSLIFDCMCWIIFDKTIRGIGKDDVCGIFKNNTNGTIEIDIGSNQYMVERYRKHTTKKNEVVLWTKNSEDKWEDISKSTADQTTKYIAELLGMSFNTFRNSILFGQGDTHKFADSSDASRKEIFDSIMEIASFQEGRKEFSKRKNDVANKAQTADSNVRVLSNQVDSLMKLLIEEQSYIETFEREKKEKIEKLEKAYDVCTKDLRLCEDKLFACTDEITKQEKIKQQIEVERDSELLTSDRIEEMNDRRTEIIGGLAKIAASSSSNDSRIRDLELKIKNLKEGEGDECDECGSLVTEGVIEHFEEKHSAKIEEIKAKELKLKEIRKKFQRINKEINEKLERNEKRKKFFKSEIDVVDGLIGIQKNNRKGFEIDVAKKKMMREQILRDLKQERNREHRSAVDSVDQRLSEARSKLMVAAVSNKHWTNEFTKNTILETAFGNKGIKNIVIRHSIPVLNSAAEEYAKILAENDIEIEFVGNRTTKGGKVKQEFDIIITEGGVSRPYAYYSGGEKRRVSLCIDLSLMRLVSCRAGAKVNLQLFDEVFDALDTEGKDRAFELMRKESDVTPSVICITHDDDMRQKFSNRVIVVREGGKSKIEE